MVSLPGARVVVATRAVDFRKGHDSLAAVVQNDLGLDPYSGVAFVFRSRRGDRLKVLWWDGTGLVLAYKRLEQGRFAWPGVHDGVMRLSRAQFRGGAQVANGDLPLPVDAWPSGIHVPEAPEPAAPASSGSGRGRMARIDAPERRLCRGRSRLQTRGDRTDRQP